MQNEYDLGFIETERGQESAIGYQPVFAVPAGGGGAPSDGIWLTGQVAVRGSILPVPGTVQRAAEPPAWPRWVAIGIIGWLFCLGAVFGIAVAALFHGG